MTDTTPSFPQLSDDIDFIARAPREYRLRAMEWLARVHQEKPLRSLYASEACGRGSTWARYL